MNGNWLTVVIGGALTVVPQILSVVPAPYSELASAVLAAAVAGWHLYQPSPSAAVKK
jgi:hypothetical protein